MKEIGDGIQSKRVYQTSQQSVRCRACAIDGDEEERVTIGNLLGFSTCTTPGIHGSNAMYTGILASLAYLAYTSTLAYVIEDLFCNDHSLCMMMKTNRIAPFAHLERQ